MEGDTTGRAEPRRVASEQLAVIGAHLYERASSPLALLPVVLVLVAATAVREAPAMRATRCGGAHSCDGDSRVSVLACRGNRDEGRGPLRKLLVLLTAITAVAVAATPASAVLYGQPDEGEHPYVGIVRFFDEDGNYLWRCTGTLISPTVVLTAGHCTFGTASAEVWFSDTAPSTAEVLSGDYTRGITGETYTHPDYDDFATFPNTSDVGIVVLDKQVRLATYGSLPTVGLADTLYKHELFTIVGYGVQDVQPVQVADVQRIQATVKLISLQSGYSAGFNLQLSSNQGQPHKGGLCFGDSGGPVLYGTTILAVNSFVLNNNCAGSGFSYRIDQPEILVWIKSFL
jgi:Trypsin